MPRPSLRSRSLRRLKRTTPGGRRVIHYERRPPGKAKCHSCGKLLPGVSLTRGIPKTWRRPERAYGGALCSLCARTEIKRRTIWKE